MEAKEVTITPLTKDGTQAAAPLSMLGPLVLDLAEDEAEHGDDPVISFPNFFEMLFSIPIEAGKTDDMLAFLLCQLRHDHDVRGCIPLNVVLGEE